MGALPSRESHESPFSLHIAHNGSYSLTMLPVTPHFFPSPTSLAFRQLYECRDRQSVKYSFPLLSSSYGLSHVPRGQSAATAVRREVADLTTPPTAVTADNYTQLFGDPLQYTPCQEDTEPDPFLQYTTEIDGEVTPQSSLSGTNRMPAGKPQYKDLQSTYDTLVVQPTMGYVVDTNVEMCKLFQDELRWRQARDVVRAHRRAARSPDTATTAPIDGDALAAALRVPPPRVFLRPLSQVIVFKMSREDEVAAREAWREAHGVASDERGGVQVEGTTRSPHQAGAMSDVDDRDDVEAAADATHQGRGRGSSAEEPACRYRFEDEPRYKDGRLHLVEEDGVLYLFAYNPHYQTGPGGPGARSNESSTTPCRDVRSTLETTNDVPVHDPQSRKSSLDGQSDKANDDSTGGPAGVNDPARTNSYATGSSAPNTALRDTQMSRITHLGSVMQSCSSTTLTNPAEEEDETGVKDAKDLWLLPQGGDGPFILPITPIRVMGYNGLLESHCRGTPWLRGVDNDADEDRYIEHELHPKPPVLRAYSFIDAVIGDKILSRAYLLVVQTYRQLCLDAGLPDILVRPLWVMKLLANVPWLQLCCELRLRVLAAVKGIAPRGARSDVVAGDDASDEGCVATTPAHQLLKALLASMAEDKAAEVRQWMCDPVENNEYGALFAIRGSSLLVRMRPDAQRLFLTLFSLTTAPLSAAHFKMPIDPAAYDYGGTVSLHALRCGVAGDRRERQVLGLPKELGLILRNAAARSQQLSTDKAATTPTVVCVVTEASAEAAGPSVQHNRRILSAAVCDKAADARPALEDVSDTEVAATRLACRHQFLYPPGTFVDGDLVTYDVARGCWEHLSGCKTTCDATSTPHDETQTVVTGVSTHETTATKIKEDVATRPVRLHCGVRLEQILLCWIKTQLHAASLRSRSDSGWLRDERHDIVQDGRYSIWTFEHDRQRFYFGLIPKFAREKRKLTRSATAVRQQSTSIPQPRNLQAAQSQQRQPPVQRGNDGGRRGISRGGGGGGSSSGSHYNAARGATGPPQSWGEPMKSYTDRAREPGPGSSDANRGARGATMYRGYPRGGVPQPYWRGMYNTSVTPTWSPPVVSLQTQVQHSSPIAPRRGAYRQELSPYSMPQHSDAARRRQGPSGGVEMQWRNGRTEGDLREMPMSGPNAPCLAGNSVTCNRAGIDFANQQPHRLMPPPAPHPVPVFGAYSQQPPPPQLSQQQPRYPVAPLSMSASHVTPMRGAGPVPCEAQRGTPILSGFAGPAQVSPQSLYNASMTAYVPTPTSHQQQQKQPPLPLPQQTQRPASIHIPLHVDPLAPMPLVAAAAPPKWPAVGGATTGPPVVAQMQSWHGPGSTTAPPQPRSQTVMAGFEGRGRPTTVGLPAPATSTATVPQPIYGAPPYARPAQPAPAIHSVTVGNYHTLSAPPASPPLSGVASKMIAVGPPQPPPSPLLPQTPSVGVVVRSKVSPAVQPRAQRAARVVVTDPMRSAASETVTQTSASSPHTITVTPSQRQSGGGDGQTGGGGAHRFTWNPYGS